jgi:single-strand DNA-binding protein
MASFNKVILAGNLTRDPELRTLPSGQAITKFALAVNRRYATKEGEQREEVTFVDIDSFGKQAEAIAKYCAKGRPLLVEGRLKLDQWDDKTTGEKKSRMGVVLENFTFLDSRAGGEGGAPAAGGSTYDASSPPPRRAAPAAAPAAARAPAPAADGAVEEDVPF